MHTTRTQNSNSTLDTRKILAVCIYGSTQLCGRKVVDRVLEFLPQTGKKVASRLCMCAPSALVTHLFRTDGNKRNWCNPYITDARELCGQWFVTNTPKKRVILENVKFLRTKFADQSLVHAVTEPHTVEGAVFPPPTRRSRCCVLLYRRNTQHSTHTTQHNT